MEPIDLATILAANVRRLLAEQSPPWTQGELARRAEWPPGNVSRLLGGTRTPRAETLAQLANVFGVPVAELLREDATTKAKLPKKEKPGRGRPKKDG